MKFGQIALQVGSALLDIHESCRHSAAEKSAYFQLRREKVAEAHTKQFEETEETLTTRLAPILESQVNSIGSNLYGLQPIESEDIEEVARNLVERAYNPRQWDDKIVGTSLPVMALAMVVTVVNFYREMGIDLLSGKSVIYPRKQSDATSWIEDHPDDWEALLAEVQRVGLPFGVMTQIPESIRQMIMEELENSFSQPYWKTISETTGGDAEVYIRQGIEKGWSIDKIASHFSSHFQGTGTKEYAERRARTIAITETGNGLNGARKRSTQQIQEEIPQVSIRQVWLSILSDTTRDTHANLDGVPEDEDGHWNLSGYTIPWPSHYTLPVNERANCKCSIVAEFGMPDEEAQQLISEYGDRLSEVEA